MRHEQHLLSKAESRKLIDDVDAWLRRTGTKYNRLVTAARVNASTRHCVRIKHRRLTIDTAHRLRDAMWEHPQGITHREHKAALRIAAQERRDRERARRESQPQPEHVGDGGAECPLCGALRRRGCAHWAKLPSTDAPAARHYHAGLLSAGWSMTGGVYRKTGRIAVHGVGVLKVVCEVAPELLDFVPDPLARAEAEYADRAADMSATAYFECGVAACERIET